MYKGKTILGLIPARGGSKGLPNKNIRSFLRKPLIAWTIEQALESKYLDRVVVSTDSKPVAQICVMRGAEVPFMRPEELATDEASSIDVINHAIKELKPSTFDYIMLLEPTSPLRETEDIDISINMLISTPDKKAIVSIAPLEGKHPDFHVITTADNCIWGFFNTTRRQDLSEVYCPDGTIYMSDIEALKKWKTFYHDLTLAYVVPRWKGTEIDELPDLIMAEALMRARLKGEI